ncbi:radical SAM protein [Acidobacteriota bacterium]
MSLPFKYFPSTSAAFATNYRILNLYIHSGSLKAWAQVGSHFWKKLKGRPTPTYATVAVTYRCQSKCKHCYSSSTNRALEEELTTEQIKSVLRQVRDLGALTVHFSGGEPLLRNDIYDLIAYAGDLGLLTRVNTNGSLLNEDSAKQLKAVGLTECGVSLDSADPAIHNRFRGTANLHEKTVQGIRILREVGVPCRILTVALKDGIPEDLEKTIALGRSLGAGFMYIVIPIATGGWDGDYDQILTSRERAQIREMQDLTFAHLEMPTRNTKCCSYEKDLFYVRANGDVTPCAFVPYVLGNIKEQSLETIWRKHCQSLNLVCRGDCPMNIPSERRALREHVDKVAHQLKSMVQDRSRAAS